MSIAAVTPAKQEGFAALFIETSSLGTERALQIWNLAWACNSGWCTEPTFNDEAERCTFATFKHFLKKPPAIIH
jgi:hypothetical protein